MLDNWMVSTELSRQPRCHQHGGLPSQLLSICHAWAFLACLHFQSTDGLAFFGGGESDCPSWSDLGTSDRDALLCEARPLDVGAALDLELWRVFEGGFTASSFSSASGSMV